MPWLTLMTFLPLAGAVMVGLGSRGRTARVLALAFHGALFGMALGLAWNFEPGQGGMQFEERHAWLPSMGVEYRLGIDGLGLVSVLLAAGVPWFAAAMSGRAANGRENLYHALVLMLQCGLMGTFTALNFFHWFLFWELGLVPAYLLVRMFGEAGAGSAAFQFFVYTMVGSIALLLGFLALNAAGGSFDFEELAAFGRSGQLGPALADGIPWAGLVASGEGLAWLVFAGVLLGFAVKVPLWPFHTWLPDTYTAAPSAVTMVLTGVLSKMGVYGLLRIALPIFPEQFRALQPVLVALALATVVLPVFAAFAQEDLKRVLAYSSINHLGYCLLGIFVAGGQAGSGPAGGSALVQGVVLQMLNHGLVAATLFACSEVLERRSEGTRELGEFGGLRRVAPVFCGLMGISVFASVGLPGLNGFVSEFLIFRGVFGGMPWAAAVGVIGLLGTAVFLLTMMQRIFHGPLAGAWAWMPDLNGGERWMLGVPVGLMFVLGIYPELVMRWINPFAMATGS